MNRLFLGSIALAAFAGPALAADIPVKAAPPAVAAVVYNWTGFYAGVDGGYGWGKTRWTNANTNFYGVAGQFIDYNDFSGGILSGHVGANYQINQIVLGVEGMFAFTTMHQTDRGAFGFPTDDHDVFLKNIASVTGKIGFARDSWMIYGKGGWATARAQYHARFMTGAPPQICICSEDTAWINGWTAGAGVEWMLSPTVIFGLAYDHYDFRTKRLSGPLLVNGVPAVGADVAVNFGPTRVDAVTARLSFKFWPWDAPVSARN